MIESIQLKSFQNHKRLLVDLDPLCTTIVGDSAAGKSAVLRALRWVLTNNFRGKSFIGDWGEARAAVGIVKIDGHTIVRRVGKRINTYKLDKKILKAPGTGVPQAIGDIVNVGPTNFQGQLDQPLWFTLSPPEVSRRLNEIINLKSIDKALNIAAKNVRKSKLAVTISTERLTKVRIELRGSRWQKAFCAQAEALQRLTEKRSANALKLRQIDSVLERASEASRAVRRAQRVIKPGSALIRIARRRRANRAHLDRIRELLNRITALRLGGKTPIPDATEIEKWRLRRGANVVKLRRLESLLYGIEMQEMEIDSVTDQLRTSEKRLRPFLKGRCPVCQQPLPKQPRFLKRKRYG